MACHIPADAPFLLRNILTWDTETPAFVYVQNENCKIQVR